MLDLCTQCVYLMKDKDGDFVIARASQSSIFNMKTVVAARMTRSEQGIRESKPCAAPAKSISIVKSDHWSV